MNIILEPDEQKLKADVLFLAGGDRDLAMDLLVRCHAISCQRISAGFARSGSLAGPRFHPKAKAPSIEDLKATDPEATSPL